jgi:hypothetical protein
MNDERLSALVDRYLDGQLTPSEKAELEDSLRRSAAAREQFWRETRLHALLHEVENDTAGVDTAVVRAAKRLPLSRKVWWTAGAAACLALTVTAAAYFWSRPTPVSEPTTAAVAVLTRAVDVQWSEPSKAYRIGAALAPGWLRLRTGLAQVEFFNGARVLLEGPAELQLVSASQAFFRHGRLSAEVPPQAVGFTVDTPQVNVVDRGTAFGLDVTGDGAEVHVFKGEVTAGKQRLKEGEAVTVAGDGQSRRMPATPVAFPSVAEFERRSSEAQQRLLAAWRGAARERNADSALLLRFDFESFPASRALPNVAARGELAGDGTIVGCEQTEGRWPGKGALGFHSVGDRVRIHVPGQLRSVTLAAWVRVDGLDRTFNSLVMSQGYDAGALHWQINQQGVVHIGVRGSDKSSTHDYGTPVVFTPDRFGRWTHLAVVFDADAGQVTHYVDGAPAARLPIRSPVALQIGYADIGNWSVGKHSTIYPVRHFSGRMDELAVFSRALADGEIQELYQTSAPQPAPIEVTQ